MQDKQGKEIVDSQGNTYKSTRDSKVKQFLKDNVWNILGTGLDEFGNFKEFFCFMLKFLWDRWKVF